MGKANPHGLERLFIVVASCLNEPGVKVLAGLREGKALRKKFMDLRRISASQQGLRTEKIDFPLVSDLLTLLLS